MRESSKSKDIKGLDPDTKLHRTGLEKYLEVIFPGVEWIHDKGFEHNGVKYKKRPDYRNAQENIIIEFDGLQHYTNPDRIRQDVENEKLYRSCGYNVIRIPYFIQLTNDVVFKMFGVTVDDVLFNPNIPSMGINGKNSPAYTCPAGLKRMAREFKKYPQQYEVNLQALKDFNNDYLTGVSMLEEEYNRL